MDLESFERYMEMKRKAAAEMTGDRLVERVWDIIRQGYDPEDYSSVPDEAVIHEIGERLKRLEAIDANG